MDLMVVEVYSQLGEVTQCETEVLVVANTAALQVQGHICLMEEVPLEQHCRETDRGESLEVVRDGQIAEPVSLAEEHIGWLLKMVGQAAGRSEDDQLSTASSYEEVLDLSVEVGVESELP